MKNNDISYPRRSSRELNLGGVMLGGTYPIRVQSMTNTDTRNAEATLAQIDELVRAGCEIVRVAIPDEQAAKALRKIVLDSEIPVVADIHFDYRLAILAAEKGAACLRINPGNIGSAEKVAKVVNAAKKHGIPIRIGINSGSVERDLLKKHGGPKAAALVESALGQIRLLEKFKFTEIKISMKSSSVLHSLEAYELLAKEVDYPFHIGITEAGLGERGAAKSGVGLGILLYRGLGDTLRVSLTGSPVDELPVAWEILASLGLRRRGPEIIACPTCGRTEIDVTTLAAEVEKRLRHLPDVFTVAVMGCPVNGPGEASQADIGLAGGRDLGIIFRQGKIVRKVHGPGLLEEFMREIEMFLAEKSSGQF